MPFNDVIPDYVVYEMLSNYQLELKLETPEYWLEEADCCDVPHRIRCIKTETNSSFSSYGTIDHPSFTMLRNHLAVKGYINKQESWVSEDIVTRKFILNNIVFDVGDQFPCASAIMRYKLFKN